MLRVCFFGSYERNYDRNRILLRALSLKGVEVHECHTELFDEKKDKSKAFDKKKGSGKLSLILGILKAQLSLLLKYCFRTPGHDVVIVGYLGYPSFPLARLLTWINRKPLVFDAFISLSDTLIDDRKLVRPSSLIGLLLRKYDQVCARLADQVWIDTQGHVDYFVEKFGVTRSKIHSIWVGADDRDFFKDSKEIDGSGKFRVLHYAKFAPLHGIQHIIDAAEILKERKEIEFTLVGTGQLESEILKRIERDKISNIRHIRWMTPEEIRSELNRSDVSLGIFGESSKARRVIPNKVYQSLACACPVITSDTPGVRELLSHGDSAYLCQPSGKAITDAILDLVENPDLRQKLGDRGLEVYSDHASPKALGDVIMGYLNYSDVNSKSESKGEISHDSLQ